MSHNHKMLSIIVPVFNEHPNLPVFYHEIRKTLAKIPYQYELIFVNDGSTDGSAHFIEARALENKCVVYIEFSRNFGKEVATTAGLHASTGHAAIIIDADMQHPVEMIPQFVNRWESGSEIVIGVRQGSSSDTKVKRAGSKLFYWLMKHLSETDFIPQATDFRLIDRAVINEFNRLTEKERITRGLIDWLGFRRETIPFEANERLHGSGRYSFVKLVRLAVNGFISHSFFPLRIAGYIGVFITFSALALGLVEFLDRYFFAWHLHFSGTAMLATFTVFLVGLVLTCLGLITFYISSIYRETQNRPMYVVRKRVNVKE